MRYEVVPSYRWFNSKTGATASIYGACPWFDGRSTKDDWERQQVGWTVFDTVNNTYGIGLRPWNTEGEAQTWADAENTRLARFAA